MWVIVEQRLGKHIPRSDEYTRNSWRTVGGIVFCEVHVVSKGISQLVLPRTSYDYATEKHITVSISCQWYDSCIDFRNCLFLFTRSPLVMSSSHIITQIWYKLDIGNFTCSSVSVRTFRPYNTHGRGKKVCHVRRVAFHVRNVSLCFCDASKLFIDPNVHVCRIKFKLDRRVIHLEFTL